MKRSSHLTRLLIENISSFSPYKGGKASYLKTYDPSPTINVDLVSRLDIMRAIKLLADRGDLSQQEIKMLQYVALDGRLSRREISTMIKEEEGIYIDQRTISRRLDSAYNKVSRFLGWEYSDERVFKMIARNLGYPPPYILSAEEIDKVVSTWERI